MNKLFNAIKSANKLFYILAAVFLWALLFLMSSDVLGRLLCDSPINGSIEISTYLLAALAFLGLGYAQLKGRLAKLDMLTSHFPKIVRKVLNIILLLLSSAFFAMMCRQTALVAYKDWQMKNLFSGSVVNLPVWIVSFSLSRLCSAYNHPAGPGGPSGNWGEDGTGIKGGCTHESGTGCCGNDMPYDGFDGLRNARSLRHDRSR